MAEHEGDQVFLPLGSCIACIGGHKVRCRGVSVTRTYGSGNRGTGIMHIHINNRSGSLTPGINHNISWKQPHVYTPDLFMVGFADVWHTALPARAIHYIFLLQPNIRKHMPRS